MSQGFWLSDAQWERLAPLLPNKPRGVPRVDDRRVISGIVVALRSGGRWIDVPSEYGPRKTLYNRFVRWSAQGVWQTVFETLAAAGGPPATVLLDSTHVSWPTEPTTPMPSASRSKARVPSRTSRPSEPGGGEAASARCYTATATRSSACSAG